MLENPIELLASDVRSVAKQVLRIRCEYETDAPTLGQASAYLNLLATMLAEVNEDEEES